MVVPGERGDAIAGLDAQVLERVRQPMDALAELAIGVAVRAGRAAGDDLAIGEQARAPLEDVLQA